MVFEGLGIAPDLQAGQLSPRKDGFTSQPLKRLGESETTVTGWTDRTIHEGQEIYLYAFLRVLRRI